MRYICVRKCYHGGKIFEKGKTYELTAKSRGDCKHLKPVTPARAETMPELEDEIQETPEAQLLKEAEAEDIKNRSPRRGKGKAGKKPETTDDDKKPDRFLE